MLTKRDAIITTRKLAEITLQSYNLATPLLVQSLVHDAHTTISTEDFLVILKHSLHIYKKNEEMFPIYIYIFSIK